MKMYKTTEVLPTIQEGMFCVPVIGVWYDSEYAEDYPDDVDKHWYWDRAMYTTKGWVETFFVYSDEVNEVTKEWSDGSASVHVARCPPSLGYQPPAYWAYVDLEGLEV